MMRIAALSLSVLGVVSAMACGGAVPATSPMAVPSAKEGTVPAQQATGGATTAWNCQGAPPNDFGWEQHVAYDEKARPGAASHIVQKAREEMAAKLCRGPKGSCGALISQVYEGAHGENATTVCAVARVRSDELQRWQERAESLSRFDEKLTEIAKDIAKLADGKLVLIRRVQDEHVAGGDRASWFADQAAVVFNKSGVRVGKVPNDWSGEPTADFPVVVEGRMYSRTENGIPTLEMFLDASTLAGEQKTFGPLRAPEGVAPLAPKESLPAPLESRGLSLQLDPSREKSGGSFCSGDRTNLYLKSDRDGVVRLFDLYGDGEALLSFPNDQATKGDIRANVHKRLGGELGYEIVKYKEFEKERYVALVAESLFAMGDLGRLHAPGQSAGECRVPARFIPLLRDGKGLPSTVRAVSADYRVLASDRCAAPQVKVGVVTSMASVPECVL